MRFDDVRRIDLGTFVRPAEETGTGRPRVEAVDGYVVRTAAGVLLLDTGLGEAGPEVDAWYRPRRVTVEEALHAVDLAAADVAVVLVIVSVDWFNKKAKHGDLGTMLFKPSCKTGGSWSQTSIYPPNSVSLSVIRRPESGGSRSDVVVVRGLGCGRNTSNAPRTGRIERMASSHLGSYH